ncbi:MAG: hypothetical protein MI892_04020, partial [Desulfobacterales bacterium]|nr:hypothetical protein [Desulfobacterales bacterium]
MKKNKTNKKHTSWFATHRLALLIVLLTVVVLFLFFTFYVKMQFEAELSEASQPTYLYVQTAHSGTLSPEQADGRRILTLNDVSPVTVFFSEGPDREAGHEMTEAFISLWDGESGNFASNPPNAALDIIGEDSQSIVIVELVSAQYDVQNKTLEYEVIILDNETDGDLPQSFGEAALFIDSTYKNYWCDCSLNEASSCSCEYNYRLGKSATKEFRGYCINQEADNPIMISFSGKN